MTTVINKSFPDGSSLPLVADSQYREPYASEAMNRKFRGILPMGIYKGLYPEPGAGLNLLITSIDSGSKSGTASFDIGDNYQLSVRQQADITLPMTAGTAKVVVLQCIFARGLETYQVNSDSDVQAAEILLLDVGSALASNQLELCTVTVPAGATQITVDMIDTSNRIIQSIGIQLSDAIDSDSETIGANLKGVKAAVAAAKTETTKQITALVDEAPANLDTIGLLAQALSNDPAFAQTMATALRGKMAIAENGADIADVPTFLENLGLGEAFYGRLLNVQKFTASGTYTPTTGTKAILVEVQGAGGGGGNASAANTSSVAVGAGGGAGGYAKSYLIIIPSSATVIIGAGGTGASAGGKSSFNGTIIANGGSAGGSTISGGWSNGTVGQNVSAGGGTASGGNLINAPGGDGTNAIYTTIGNCVSGGGGSSFYAGGKRGVGGGTQAGQNGTHGSGGSGANATNTTTQYSGGTGGDGFVHIYEFA